MKPDHIVYVVDPDESIGDALTALLGTYDIQVRVFPTADLFLDAYSATSLTGCCLLVEANLPRLSGLSLLRQLRARGFTLPVIILTNPADQDIRQQAMQFGATDVLEKPLIKGVLAERLLKLLSATTPTLKTNHR